MIAQLHFPTTADELFALIGQAAAQRGRMSVQVHEYQGSAALWPIHVVHYWPKQPRARGLIVTGIHGEEPAGPWAVLEFLRLVADRPELAGDCELVIMSLLNPQGFDQRVRMAPLGLDLNRGHVHVEPPPIVRPWITALHELVEGEAFDFVLSLHEDSDFSTFYLYSYESAAPVLGRAIIDFMRPYFATATETLIENVPVDGGLLVGNHDGSFEDWLYHLGIPRILVPEVPGKAGAKERVNASLEIILFLLRQAHLKDGR